MDGTITQSNELIYASFNCVAEKYLHKQFTPLEITRMFGPTEEKVIEMLVGKEHFDEARNVFWNFYREQHNALSSLYDGVIELLEFLSANNILVAMFTGKGKVSVGISLELFDIKKYFDIIITGHDVTKSKPSGEGIQIILDALSLAPEETLMVGDAISDIKAAEETGVPCAVALWDSYAKEEIELLNPSLKFYSVQKFTQWIEEIVLKQTIRHPELVSGTLVESKEMLKQVQHDEYK